MRKLTYSLTLLRLMNALRTDTTGVVVWTIDANGDLQTAHELPASDIPSVMLDTHTGEVYLFQGSTRVKQLARLTKP